MIPPRTKAAGVPSGGCRRRYSGSEEMEAHTTSATTSATTTFGTRRFRSEEFVVVEEIFFRDDAVAFIRERFQTQIDVIDVQGNRCPAVTPV